jgi:hypothetical protein
VAVRRPVVVAGLAEERPRDHTPDRVFAGEDSARRLAGRVELGQRHGLLVRGDLEDGVGRRVDDPLAGPLMLLAELLDDLRARRRSVPEHAAPRAVHEWVDHVVGKAVPVGGEGRRRHDAHQLPVPGRRVLPARPLREAAGDGRSARLGRAALERLNVSEPECLEVGEIEAADGPGDIPERVRSFIPVLVGIRQCAGADGVEHDHAGPWHAAILGGSFRATTTAILLS